MLLMSLEPHKPLNPVPPREPRHDFVLMFLDAAAKVGGHTDVERTVGLAGEDVDVEHPISCLVGSRPEFILGPSAGRTVGRDGIVIVNDGGCRNRG
jgi:hypothetical protein